MTEVRQPVPGEAVVFTDEFAVEHDALLTAVHGDATEHGQPAVNLVFVTGDESKRDPYGLQIERSSSVVHKVSQSAHGMFWTFSS